MAQTLFRNARVLDCEAGRATAGCSVLVEDERIVEVGEGEISAADARRIDVGGRTLMPGLIDAHVHAVITTIVALHRPSDRHPVNVFLRIFLRILKFFSKISGVRTPHLRQDLHRSEGAPVRFGALNRWVV